MTSGEVTYRIWGAADEVDLLQTMLPPQHRIRRRMLTELLVAAPANTTLPALVRMFPTLECGVYGE